MRPRKTSRAPPHAMPDNYYNQMFPCYFSIKIAQLMRGKRLRGKNSKTAHASLALRVVVIRAGVGTRIPLDTGTLKNTFQ